MKRLAAAFGLTVACTFLLVPAADAGVARSKSGQSPIAIDAQGGAQLDISADPGTNQERTVAVANRDANSHTVLVSVVSADPNRSGWVALTDTALDIAANSAQTLTVRIAVPQEAVAGAAQFSIVADLDDSATAPGITFPVNVQVGGPARAALRVQSVKGSRPGGQVAFAVVLHNDGAVPVQATGTLDAFAGNVTEQFTADVPAHGDQTVAVPWRTRINESAPVTVTMHYGGDVANWSGTVLPAGARPTTATAAPAAAPARSAAATETAAAPASGTDGSTIALIVLIVVFLLAALGWLVYEIVASKRQPPHTVGGSVLAAPAGGAVVVVSIADQLAPLVAAIEQLAASFNPASVPVAAVAQEPEPEPAPEGEPDVAPAQAIAPAHETAPETENEPQVVVDDVEAPLSAPSTEEPMSADSDSYFTDEEYARPELQPIGVPTPPVPPAPPAPLPVDHAGVDALSRIEAAALIVRDTYRDPQIEVETKEVIEAHIVADDAQHRAALIDSVAEGLGIPKAVLLEWMPDDVFELTEVPAEPVDVAALQRQNRILELQVAILKRAVSHFAQS